MFVRWHKDFFLPIDRLNYIIYSRVMTNVLLILQLLYNIYGEDIYSVTIKGTLITVNLDIDILPKLSNVDVVFER